ncbi:MAG: SHOCT domain-containing protein [Succinivibrionaceae bacterium]|nr:SHOCT domain-containing protein [Succinivibrionaceae bacterium]
MQITNLPSNEVKNSPAIRKYTKEELLNEFKFMRAEQITGMLLSRGLITADEYRLIMAENKLSFPTFLSSIL